jgi:hypothetical protein
MLGLGRITTTVIILAIGAYFVQRQMKGGKMTRCAWVTGAGVVLIAWAVYSGNVMEGFRDDTRARHIIDRNIVAPFLSKAEGDELIEKTLPNRDYLSKEQLYKQD